MYLIDTNVISELRKKANANAGVISFVSETQKSDAATFLSAVTIGELRRGVDLVRHRGDLVQAALLEQWLRTVISEFADKILTLDVAAAQIWGRLRVPDPARVLDKQIAAIALQYDLTVVTRNINDFRHTGVRLINPFVAEPPQRMSK